MDWDDNGEPTTTLEIEREAKKWLNKFKSPNSDRMWRLPTFLPNHHFGFVDILLNI
jgi:hypothetical protein